jgi:formylglycine-generating enzyme required for sulfatase activity
MVYSKGYALSPKTLHITLADIHAGISGEKPLELALEMVPKHLVPKGMIVIPEMEVYIGDDPTQMKASPFELNSQSQHKVKIGPFLMDKYLTIVRDYREFLEARLKEIQAEFDRDPKMRTSQKEQILKDTFDPLIPGDPFTKKTVTIKKRIASAMDKFRKKKEPEVEEEDQFYWRRIKVKEGRKKVWKLNNPKNPKNHHGKPVDMKKPVEAITPLAALEFLKWKSLTNHQYRLGKINELEGVARGGFPWIYPFGDIFDPFKVACRACFPDIGRNITMRIGRHPVTGITGDRSPLGSVDVTGNVREFSSSKAEKDAIFVFGGSVSIYNGTSFKPSNRPPMLVYAKYDSYGFRKVLDLPPKMVNHSD